MPQYIKKIRTSSGDLKIDYESLANLPKLGALAPKNKVGKTDLASDVLENYATLKQVDEKIAVVNNALDDISWNDLTDKPFGEVSTTGPFTITVDWNTFVPEVETSSADHWGYIKVSDATPTLDDFTNGLSYIKESTTTEMSYDEILANCNETNGNLFFYDIFIVAPTDNYYLDLGGWGDVTCPEKGIYFRQDTVTSLTINSYAITTIKQLDEKYIPIDATLTQVGVPADAKAVGDKFTTLETELKAYIDETFLGGEW